MDIPHLISVLRISPQRSNTGIPGKYIHRFTPRCNTPSRVTRPGQLFVIVELWSELRFLITKQVVSGLNSSSIFAFVLPPAVFPKFSFACPANRFFKILLRLPRKPIFQNSPSFTPQAPNPKQPIFFLVFLSIRL